MILSNKNKFRYISLGLALVFLLGVCQENLYATNGYFRHGYGIQYRMMGGAGVALYLSPLGVATNPAGAAFLGKQVDFGVSMFNPNREFTVAGSPSGFPMTFGLAPGNVESDSRLFFIPNFGINLPFGSGNSFTLALYGNGGMNTDYDNPTFGFKPTGVDLSQFFINATFAKQIASDHSLGVSAIVAYQRFRGEGFAAFGPFSSDPANLTNNDHDSAFGFGARFGYMGNLSPYFSLGGAYQTKILMGKFDKYAGLFAEQGGFDIPSNFTVGAAVKPIPELTIAPDFQRIMYGEIASIANPFLPNLQQSPLGSDQGAGFGWRDMNIFKVGVQYDATPGLTFRAGYSVGGQPVPESEIMFNIVAPGIIEQQISFGIFKNLTEGIILNLGFMHGFSNTISGPNPLEVPGQQSISLKMNQFEADFGLTFKF